MTEKEQIQHYRNIVKITKSTLRPLKHPAVVDLMKMIEKMEREVG
jgi:hypothetical protein